MRWDKPIRFIWYYGFCEIFARIKFCTHAFENPGYAWWSYQIHKRYLVKSCCKMSKVFR